MTKYRLLALLGLLLILLQGCVVAPVEGEYYEGAPPAYYSQPYVGGWFWAPVHRDGHHEGRRGDFHEGRHDPRHPGGTPHAGRSEGRVGHHEWGGRH
jgi:hypothetical protein